MPEFIGTIDFPFDTDTFTVSLTAGTYGTTSSSKGCRPAPARCRTRS